MRPAVGVLASAALFVLLAGLEWEGSRARWLRDVASGDQAHRIDALHGLATLTGADVDEAIAAALADGSEDVRLEAAFACEARALARCAAPIADWLDASDPDVRAVAARVLGHVGTDADAPRLARMLGDARPQVRRAAVLGLGALGGSAAVQALISALADADPIVRERSVTALGEIGAAAGERTAASSAAISLVRDEAPEVRAAALDALGSLGDPRASSAAAVALDDDIVEVRLAAMRTATLVPSGTATAALVRASADEDREGRAALAALGRAPGDAALEALVAALLRASVARSAEDALEARARESESSRVEVMSAIARSIETSSSADRIARFAASASRLSLRVSTVGLQDALAAAYRSNGAAAVLEALGRTGSERALVPILDALASEAPSTRSAALSGLEGLASVHAPDGRILDPLSVAFPGLVADEQARAVAIVGAVAGARASDWLLARLADGSRAARIAALRALRSRAPRAGTPQLVALLADPDAEIRSRAALALAELAHTDAIDEVFVTQLADALVSDAPNDRHAILLALGPMLRTTVEGDTRTHARAALLHAFDASDPELADSAAWAIAASGDVALMRALLARAGSIGPTVTTRIVRVSSGADPTMTEARAFCASQLDAADPRVRVAALVTLAEIGDSDSAAAIGARVGAARFPENAAIAFALARMARRGVAASAIVASLATLARAHDPYVRANVAIAAAALRVASVGDASPLDWLTSASPIVRAAAARWAFAVRADLDAARLDSLLAACATDPSQPAVARSCGAPAIDSAIEDADLIALDTSSRPMPERLVALRLADGSALVTYTDARGRVRLAGAPAGPLSLDAPESAVLVP